MCFEALNAHPEAPGAPLNPCIPGTPCAPGSLAKSVPYLLKSAEINHTLGCLGVPGGRDFPAALESRGCVHSLVEMSREERWYLSEAPGAPLQRDQFYEL